MDDNSLERSKLVNMNVFKPNHGWKYRLIVVDKSIDALVIDRSYLEFGPARQEAELQEAKYSGDDRIEVRVFDINGQMVWFPGRPVGKTFEISLGGLATAIAIFVLLAFAYSLF